jgi:hypothetical protein
VADNERACAAAFCSLKKDNEVGKKCFKLILKRTNNY